MPDLSRKPGIRQWLHYQANESAEGTSSRPRELDLRTGVSLPDDEREGEPAFPALRGWPATLTTASPRPVPPERADLTPSLELHPL